MLKLITEHQEDIKFLVEAKEDGVKEYYIEGIFMQASKKNRNGRVYPNEVLMKEAKRYQKEYVTSGRAMGELGHPEGPTLNLERVSHLVESLKQDGNNIIGKAKILETPYGKIVKNLMDGGVKLGVSSRGMGTLKQVNGINEVQKDFMLSAIDIVADPSAPDAFVNGIMEGKAWIWDNGLLKEQDLNSYCSMINRASVESKQELEEKKLLVFKNFLSKIKNV
jgi:hypothetical protein|tara:strand:- start:2361 stop:3026 length:666 start_codon:yes stop_codon:yes gene_type:complete